MANLLRREMTGAKQVSLGGFAAVEHPEDDKFANPFASPRATGPRQIAGNVQGASTDLELRSILTEHRNDTVRCCKALCLRRATEVLLACTVSLERGIARDGTVRVITAVVSLWVPVQPVHCTACP